MHYYRIITLFKCLYWIHHTDGKATFTRSPPAVKYAVQGQTVKLVWEYKVDNRNTEFEVNSPRWDYYDSDGSVLPIASEDSQYGWQWALHKDTCPQRLLNRVSKESIATLVITNVTTDESGLYGCSLVLKTSSALTRKVQLIVTTIPYFTTKPPPTNHIHESEDLVIICAASAFPKPSVKWVRTIGNKTIVKNQGIGSASLYIFNITRNQSGTYRCQANNNPNEIPLEASTEITVIISAQFSHLPPKNNLAIEGMNLELNCSAIGKPQPNVTWFHLNRGSKVTKSQGIGTATLSLPNIRRENNGTYECRAANEFSDEGMIYFSIIVMVMCHCVSLYNTTTTLKPTQELEKDYKDAEGLSEKTELQNFMNGKTFMISLLTVTCISILINIILIIFLCVKRNINRYQVAKTDKNSEWFGPPRVPKNDELQNTNDSTPATPFDGRNIQNVVIKPKIDIYERMPESASPNKEHPYAMPSEAKNNQSPKSVHSKHDQSPPTSRLQHHYQDLDDFTSTLNKHEYQSLDSSEVVPNPHPKHTSVSVPYKYETLTMSKTQKNPEYQKLHIYANVKELKPQVKQQSSL